MNSRPLFRASRRFALLALAGLLTAGGLAAETFPAWVVAERRREAAPESVKAHPGTFALLPGRYIEEGDSIANLRTAEPDAVRQAVADGLKRAGFTPVAPGAAADWVIVYHWGSMRRDSYDRSGPRGVSFNERARIRVVANATLVRTVEQTMESGVSGLPWYIHGQARDILTLANDSRYFLVVSAYEGRAAHDGEVVLGWRTKLSATDNEGAMQTVLTTLARGGASYYGADERPRSFRVTETAAADHTVDPTVPMASLPAELASGLVQREAAHLLGETLAHEYMADWRKTIAMTPFELAIPQPLEQRIVAYQTSKHALQEQLTAALKKVGPDSRAAAVDAFNRAHAAEIARLDQEREAIRSELASLAKATDGKTNRSLDELLQAFAQRREGAGAPSAGLPLAQ